MDPKNYFLFDDLFDRWTYSAGEVGVRLKSIPRMYRNDNLVINITSSNDVMALIMGLNTLSYNHIDIPNLVIPYLPYGRQDRVVTFGDPNAIDTFFGMMDMCGVHTVETYDIHSVDCVLVAAKYGIDLIDAGSIADFLTPDFERRVNCSDPIIVAPDKGAVKRAKKLADAIDCQYITLTKKRDPKTGEIIGHEVVGGKTYIQGMTAIISDDICDGGATFASAAKLLKEMGAKRVVLLVTHGIFSKGAENTKDIDEIHTFPAFGRKLEGLHPKVNYWEYPWNMPFPLTPSGKTGKQPFRPAKA